MKLAAALRGRRVANRNGGIDDSFHARLQRAFLQGRFFWVCQPGTQTPETAASEARIEVLHGPNPWNHLDFQNDPSHFTFAIVLDLTGDHEKLRIGQVELGYDEDMVHIALGEPDKASTERTVNGETLVWGYTRSRPRVSIGLDGGSYGCGGGAGGVGGGLGVGSGGGREFTAIVEFREVRVTRVRYFDK